MLFAGCGSLFEVISICFAREEFYLGTVKVVEGRLKQNGFAQ